MNRRIRKKIACRDGYKKWSAYYRYKVWKAIRYLVRKHESEIGPNDMVYTVTTKPGKHCEIVKFMIFHDCYPVSIPDTGNTIIGSNGKIHHDESSLYDDLKELQHRYEIGFDSGAPDGDHTQQVTSKFLDDMRKIWAQGVVTNG